MITTTGVLSAAAAILLLAHSWHRRIRQPQHPHPMLRGIAFTLLGVSVALLAHATGWDRAVALALLAMMLTAGVVLTAIGWRRWRSARPASERVTTAATDWPGGPAIARVAWIAVLAGPVSGIAAITTAATVVELLTGLAPPDRVGLATLLAPVIWAVLAVTATYALPLAQRTLIVAASCVAAAGLAWLASGGIS